MSTADESLTEMIRKLRALGAHLPAEVARRAAPLVLAEVQRTARAGTTPDGKPWPEKKGGGRALVHAADHLSVKANGSTIILTLTGKAEVVHNAGDKRNPKRQILPDAGAAMPPAIIEACKRAAREAWTEAMR